MGKEQVQQPGSGANEGSLGCFGWLGGEQRPVQVLDFVLQAHGVCSSREVGPA